MLSLLSKIWLKYKKIIFTSLKLHQISTNQSIAYQNYIWTKYIIFPREETQPKISKMTPAEATKASAESVTAPTDLQQLQQVDTCPKIMSSCERPHPWPVFYDMLGQTHVNGWSRVVASQNEGSTDYIFPLRLGVLQWSRHLFNYWKNKKTTIEKFLIFLI